MGWSIALPDNRDLKNKPEKNNLIIANQIRIIDQIHDAVILTDKNGKITNWNNGAEKLFGYTSEEVIGQYIYILTPHIKEFKVFQNKYLNYLKENGFDEYESKMVKKDGDIIYVETSSSLLLDENKKIEGVISYTKDISKYKRIEGKYKRNKDHYQILYNHTPTMFFSLNEKGEIVHINDYGAEQLGYSTEEIIGLHLTDLSINREKDKTLEYLEKCTLNINKIHRLESINVRKDGSIINVRQTGRMVTNQESGESNILLVSEDITSSKKLFEQLSYQETHDNLTSLINRKEFNRRLQTAIDTARSDKALHALCYIDLDRFNIINDTCGHVAGDDLLQQLSMELQKHVSKRDILARLGGDEFGLLFMYTDSNWVKKAIKKVHRTIKNFHFEWEGQKYQISSSIGISYIDENAEDVSEILKQSDAACFAAKDAGRDRIHIYGDNDTALAKRRGEIKWVNKINAAFEKNLFSIYIQDITPINSSKEGDHYEVLIRMINENGREISPGLFMSAAERYNLSPKIDRWVIVSTFQWLIEHPEQLEQLCLCSINLSGNSLCDEDFLDFITQIFETTKIPPEKICFEVTETAAIANLSGAVDFIKTVKKLGCYFALDDFGSGLSSFAYLKNLPVDILKIDGIFVKDIAVDSVDYAMVKSINEIGHVMGKRTVAEFVESKEVLEKLNEIGVDFAQGYYFCKPHPIENIID
jgi:diguanylate cyclase (GGDEF)-like protein/PAS domain S-box-containing protein